MAIELGRTGRASAAAEFLGDVTVVRAAQSVSFQEQLAGAIEQAPGVQVRANQAEVAAASQADGARQILDTAPAAAQVAGSLAASVQTAPAQTGEQQVPGGGPVDTLKQALRQAGMDPDRFALTEVRELVTYPGGGYVNHQVLFEAGAAREYYDVALMLRNPEVTVTEIRRLLALGAAPVQT